MDHPNDKGPIDRLIEIIENLKADGLEDNEINHELRGHHRTRDIRAAWACIYERGAE